MKLHSEVCYIPMCTGSKGQQWFAVRHLDWSMGEAKNSFIDSPGNEKAEWKELRKAGWRIVKVKVSEIAHPLRRHEQKKGE